MISQKKILEKVKALSDELGGVDSYVIVLEKKGEAIASFDGTLEETCENLAEGFDYFVSTLKDNKIPQEDCEEILQTLHECQIESVNKAKEPRSNIRIVK